MINTELREIVLSTAEGAGQPIASIVIAEKKPRWTILARRHLPNCGVSRAISLPLADKLVVQIERPIVLIDLESFDLVAIVQMLLNWQNGPTDPLLVASYEDSSYNRYSNDLLDMGVQEIYTGLVRFPMFKKRFIRFLDRCI